MEEELESGTVFRLASIKDTFPPNSPKLHVAHLELSDEDKAQKVPLLSVWDVSRTTVDEARAIREETRESAAYGLPVEAIRRVQVEGLRSPRVFRDPLEPPRSEMPGADGHCGIDGLYRRPGEAKKLYKELRVLLSDLSYPYSASSP